jgi:hypothetical protein
MGKLNSRCKGPILKLGPSEAKTAVGIEARPGMGEAKTAGGIDARPGMGEARSDIAGSIASTHLPLDTSLWSVITMSRYNGIVIRERTRVPDEIPRQ